jgi:cation diffusion facilitator family transporter
MYMNEVQPVRGIPHVAPISLSIVAAIVTVALKFAAYRVTGSVGLFSDAIESCINVVTAFTALFALWYASQPADRTHPYGHEKIEFFSSGIEGGLIVVAAFEIAFEAAHHFANPSLPQGLSLGIAMALVATAINFAVARVLLRTARQVDSIVLEADGHHLIADVWTSVGVVGGLVLVQWTHLAWIDPLIASLVAVNILRIGWHLLALSFDGLMDRALGEAEVAGIRGAIDATIGGDMTYHALRTRRAGTRRFADYHLLVPGHLSVKEAHACEMRIEAAILAGVPGIEVTSHIEPIEEPLAWNDTRWHEGVPEPPRLLSR